MRTDDPWYDALASGRRDLDTAPQPVCGNDRSGLRARRPPGMRRVLRQRGQEASAPRPPELPRPYDGPYDRPYADPDARTYAGSETGPDVRPYDAEAAVYLAVHRSAAFQQVRRRYRRFALPATAAFVTWYLAYLVTAAAAPGLMARPVAGVLNVAMAAGLAQFATTFLLTWAYVRHARLRRDRLALELRWEIQDMARTTAQRERAR